MRDAGIPTARERTDSAVAHLSSVYGALVPVVGAIGVAVLVWWRNGDSAFVARHARAAINFQLTMILWYGLSLAYLYAFMALGAVLLVGLTTYETVAMWRAARRARAGEFYDYRLSFRFLSGRR